MRNLKGVVFEEKNWVRHRWNWDILCSATQANAFAPFHPHILFLPLCNLKKPPLLPPFYSLTRAHVSVPFPCLFYRERVEGGERGHKKVQRREKSPRRLQPIVFPAEPSRSHVKTRQILKAAIVSRITKFLSIFSAIFIDIIPEGIYLSRFTNKLSLTHIFDKKKKQLPRARGGWNFFSPKTDPFFCPVIRDMPLIASNKPINWLL